MIVRRRVSPRTFGEPRNMLKTGHQRRERYSLPADLPRSRSARDHRPGPRATAHAFHSSIFGSTSFFPAQNCNRCSSAPDSRLPEFSTSFGNEGRTSCSTRALRPSHSPCKQSLVFSFALTLMLISFDLFFSSFLSAIHK